MYLLQLIFPDGPDTVETTPCPDWARAWFTTTRDGILPADAVTGCRVVDAGGRVLYTYAA